MNACEARLAARRLSDELAEAQPLVGDVEALGFIRASRRAEMATRLVAVIDAVLALANVLELELDLTAEHGADA